MVVRFVGVVFRLSFVRPEILSISGLDYARKQHTSRSHHLVAAVLKRLNDAVVSAFW